MIRGVEQDVFERLLIGKRGDSKAPLLVSLVAKIHGDLHMLGQKDLQDLFGRFDEMELFGTLALHGA